MANEKILNTRIALKIDTYENWTNTTQANKGANYILKRGEIGLCEITSSTQEGVQSPVPTVLFKVGTYDGVNEATKTAFKDLKWASALAADVYAWAKQAELPISDPDKDTKNGISGITFGTWTEGEKTIYGLKVARTQFATAAELAAVDAKFATIDTDTDTRYSFEKVDATTDANYGKLKITAQRYDVKTSSNIGDADVSYVDLVTPKELEDILAGYVKSVSTDSIGTIKINGNNGQNDAQNPVINFNIATGNKASNVTLTDTADGLKAEVNLTPFTDPTASGSALAFIDSISQNANGEITATKKNVDLGSYALKTELKDTKTTVSAGAYIDVEITTNNGQFKENDTNNFKVSVVESDLIALIGAQTTAAMTFCGATAVLPTTKKVDGKDVALDNGDMFKVTAAIKVAAANDAQGAGFTTKAGDAIVYDGAKWYLIPAGDSDTDTWRPVTIDGTDLSTGDDLVLNAGKHITITNTAEAGAAPAFDINLELAPDAILKDSKLKFYRSDDPVNAYAWSNDLNVTEYIDSRIHAAISAEQVTNFVTTDEWVELKRFGEGIITEYDEHLPHLGSYVVGHTYRLVIKNFYPDGRDYVTYHTADFAGEIEFKDPDGYPLASCFNYTISFSAGYAAGKYGDFTGKTYILSEVVKGVDIEAGAQVNTIETIKVNGTAQTVKDKAVDITIGNGQFTVSGTTDGAIELVDNSTGIMTANQAGNSAATLDVKAGGITTGKLADKAVTTPKIDDKAVTTVKIDDKAVTTDKIADHAVGAAQSKAEKGYTGTDAEIWVFDCGGAFTE